MLDAKRATLSRGPRCCRARLVLRTVRKIAACTSTETVSWALWTAGIRIFLRAVFFLFVSFRFGAISMLPLPVVIQLVLSIENLEATLVGAVELSWNMSL